ncbi:MAG: [protein-PII] uridylyltransferase [Deltaproteobacteria bacterium CG11_big_fil_rev_8_21_14_0_20_42_23]|nr:MAG: [protein-PII] uridylyltransferase [Deltaproteobacteria bacterium CG11_big_fil_rev_8_21_14_0_20_42_23]PJC63778.1 MAG: [protein-PII] uridylyltransferase [Deltaproteobacteria bacterium CG_4_9_14_0_2_um_filter_42_21]
MNSFLFYHHDVNDPSGSLKKFLHDVSALYQEKVASPDYDPLELCRFVSHSFDQIVLAFLSAHQISSSECCVLALGGYGRAEMSVSTDLDVLFLCTEKGLKKIEALLNDFLYPLWNNSVRIGGATRTLKDCEHVFMKGDVRSITAMLEHRFLWGSDELFSSFNVLLKKSFKKKKIYRQFLSSKKAEQSKRKKRYEQSLYLLEPNIKESPGALRWIHFIQWIITARAYYFPDKALPEGFRLKLIELDLIHRFYWRVRHSLHALAHKNQDRLYAGVQEDVAKWLYFQDTKLLLASEQLMKQYYQSAHFSHFLSQQIVEWFQLELEEKSFLPFFKKRKKEKLFSEKKNFSAEEMLSYFLEAKRKHKTISSSLMYQLSNNSHIITEKSWTSETKEMWRTFFSSSTPIYPLLSQLYECGHLERWFPELTPILHLLQHNGYHYYTVDAHSLRAVMELENLLQKKKGSSFLFAQSEATDLAVLRLAALFHDIGKGRGGDHSSLGSEIASQLAAKIGLDSERTKNLSWLVKSHLLMPKLAFRRDVSDLEMIKRFVQSLPTPSLLSSLYLLTIADLKAVGPGVWTDWKAKLLREFYHLCYEVCSHQGELNQEFEKRKKHLLQEVEDLSKKRSVPQTCIDSFFSQLPSKYFFSASPHIIAEHLFLFFSFKEKGGLQVECYADEKSNLTYLLLLDKDRHGLFSDACGILSYYGANIVEAKIFTSQNGCAVDSFALTAKDGSRFDLKKYINLIQSDFLHAQRDEHFLSGRLEKAFPHEKRKKFFDPREIKIEIDNDVSESDTVVEIHTYDEEGLLYNLSRALVDSKSSLHLAYIVTQVERVIDVFYIRNDEGKKITDKKQLKALRENIERRIL